VRGAAIIQHVPRLDPVPLAQVRAVLLAFSFTDEEFAAALQSVS
jgi:hypothetical protein